MITESELPDTGDSAVCSKDFQMPETAEMRSRKMHAPEGHASRIYWIALWVSILPHLVLSIKGIGYTMLEMALCLEVVVRCLGPI